MVQPKYQLGWEGVPVIYPLQVLQPEQFILSSPILTGWACTKGPDGGWELSWPFLGPFQVCFCLRRL